MEKLSWKVIVLIVTVLVTGTSAWLGRYEVVGINDGVAYRLDRWTGELVWVYQDAALKVKPRS
jgi:hypothetical protein